MRGVLESGAMALTLQAWLEAEREYKYIYKSGCANAIYIYRPDDTRDVIREFSAFCVYSLTADLWKNWRRYGLQVAVWDWFSAQIGSRVWT